MTPPSTRPDDGPLRKALRDRRFLRFCVAVAGAWVLVSQLYLVVPLRAREVLPSTVGLGTVYSVAAIVMVVTMLPLTRAADRWLRPEVALALATLTLGGGLLLLGLWRSPAGLVCGVVVFTIGQAVLQPIMNSRVSSFAPEGAIASYFGVHGLALAVGGIIGGVGGGNLYGLAEPRRRRVAHPCPRGGPCSLGVGALSSGPDQQDFRTAPRLATRSSS